MPAASARAAQMSPLSAPGANSSFSASTTRHSSGVSVATSVSSTRPGSGVRAPGSMSRRITWPTPSVNRRLAGISRKRRAPVWRRRKSACFRSENPCGALSVVHSR